MDKRQAILLCTPDAYGGYPEVMAITTGSANQRRGPIPRVLGCGLMSYFGELMDSSGD